MKLNESEVAGSSTSTSVSAGGFFSLTEGKVVSFSASADLRTRRSQ